MELSARSKAWVDELEAAVFNAHNASILTKVLPPFYRALDLPDHAARGVRCLVLFAGGRSKGSAALLSIGSGPECSLEPGTRNGAAGSALKNAAQFHVQLEMYVFSVLEPVEAVKPT